VKFLRSKNEKHFGWSASEKEQLVNYVMASEFNTPRHSTKVLTDPKNYFIGQYKRKMNFTLICEYVFPMDGDDCGFLIEVVNVLAFADLLVAVYENKKSFEELIELAEMTLQRGLH